MAEHAKSLQRIKRPSVKRASAPSPRSATGAARTDSIQYLQQTIGNQAIQRLVRAERISPRGALSPPGPAAPAFRPVVVTGSSPAPVVQRVVAAGLAKDGVAGAFGQVAYNFWKDPSNKDKPLEDLSDRLLAAINQELLFPCVTAYENGNRSNVAFFSRSAWTITVDTAEFSKRKGTTTVGDLSQAEVAEIVDTIFHEARHSDQYFRVARMRAGQGEDAKKIASGMEIPGAVAKLAAQYPLQGGPGATRNNAMIAEAKAWEQITVGKYVKYRQMIGALDKRSQDLFDVFAAGSDAAKITALGPKMVPLKDLIDGFFTQEKTKIEQIKDKDTFDQNALRHVNEIVVAFNQLKGEYDAQKGDPSKYDLHGLKVLAHHLRMARWDAYKDYEHEKDAWAMGAVAGKAFNAHADEQAKKKN